MGHPVRFQLRYAKVSRVDLNDGLATEVNAILFHLLSDPSGYHGESFEDRITEAAHRPLPTSCDHKVFRLPLLHQKPLHFHIILAIAPVAFGAEIAKVETVLMPEFNESQGVIVFVRDKGAIPAKTLVVEQNYYAGKHPRCVGVVAPIRVIDASAVCYSD